MSLREAGCAIRLKEVGLQAFSGQQGRGNFPRTLQPSQPATWETRAVGVALSLVIEKSGSDPWPSYIPSFLVYCTSLSLSPLSPRTPLPILILSQSSTMHQSIEVRGTRCNFCFRIENGLVGTGLPPDWGVGRGSCLVVAIQRFRARISRATVSAGIRGLPPLWLWAPPSQALGL